MPSDLHSNPEPRSVAITESVQFGPGRLVVMAGPCAVESREQLMTVAHSVAAAGASMLRGGAFKPRTRPGAFQGLGEEGLRLLQEASAATGLPVVTEVMDPRDVDLVGRHVAMLQIGSRSMQNFPLLREAGKSGLPVLLKRGASATIDELVHAAEYIAQEGNERIVFCERGLRSFDPSTRFLLDLAAVPVLKSKSPFPVVVDPSHGTGHRHLVAPLARASVAVGADGLLIEVHARPEEALSDGPQALMPEAFGELLRGITTWSPMMGRTLTVARRANEPKNAGVTAT